MGIPLLQVYSPYYLDNYSLVILQNSIYCKSVEFTGFTGLKMAGLTVHLVNSGGHQADNMRPNFVGNSDAWLRAHCKEPFLF